MRLVGSKPFHKTAAGRRQARHLRLLAGLVESVEQLDVILEQDLRLKHDPRMREAVKEEILRLNPKLKAVPVDA